MKLYRLLQAIVYNGVWQPPGAEVLLTDPQAEWLDGIDVISKDGSPKQVAAILKPPPIPKRQTGGCWSCGK